MSRHAQPLAWVPVGVGNLKAPAILLGGRPKREAHRTTQRCFAARREALRCTRRWGYDHTDGSRQMGSIKLLGSWERPVWGSSPAELDGVVARLGQDQTRPLRRASAPRFDAALPPCPNDQVSKPVSLLQLIARRDPLGGEPIVRVVLTASPGVSRRA
jgi:hypothetical protein